MTAPGTACPDTPIAGLVELALTAPTFQQLMQSTAGVPPELSLVGPAAARLFVASALAQQGSLLVVTATGREADDLAAELQGVFGSAVAVFPSWETLPHERLSPGVDTVGTRLMVLRRLAYPDDTRLGPPLRVVVTAARSLLQPMAPQLGHQEPVTLRVGLEDRLRGSDRPAGRAGLHPGGHGRPARRVRRARRDPRHLRPDRRAPGARRVLGRRGHRNADVLGSRSALHPGNRGPDADRGRLPRIAAHRGRAGPGRRAGRCSRPPAAARASRHHRQCHRHAGQAGRGHPGRRDGGAPAGAATRTMGQTPYWSNSWPRERRCWYATRKRCLPGPQT